MRSIGYLSPGYSRPMSSSVCSFMRFMYLWGFFRLSQSRFLGPELPGALSLLSLNGIFEHEENDVSHTSSFEKVFEDITQCDLDNPFCKASSMPNNRTDMNLGNSARGDSGFYMQVSFCCFAFKGYLYKKTKFSVFIV